MELIKQSAVLRLVAAFFAALERKILESAAYSCILRWIIPLWKIIDRKWNESLCMHLLRRLGTVFGSGLSYAFFTRRPALDRALNESLLIRAALWCANLVPNVLGWIYRRFNSWFEGSVFLCLCDKLPLCVLCALAVIMLVTPQEMWNNMYSLLLALTALAVFWLSGMRNPGRRLELKNIGGWTVLFFLASIMSMFWSLDFGLSLRYAFFSITSFIVLIVLVSLVEDERELVAAAVCVAAGLLAASICAVLQRAGGIEASASYTDLTANKGMPGRVYSFFENPNSFAGILVLFAPLMLTMGLDKKHKVRSAFFLAAFLLSALALVMTYSRGGWLAIALSVFALILMAKPGYAPLVIVVGLVALPMLPDTILNRIITIFTGDSSINTRMYIFDGAFGAIAMNPLLGVGLGSEIVSTAATESGRYLIVEKMKYVHAHNLYFEIWAESGLVALIPFLFSMFYSMQGAVRGARRETASPNLKRICRGCAAGLIGTMFFGLTDYPWSYPRVMVMFWLVFAMMCAAAKLCENDKTMKEI